MEEQSWHSDNASETSSFLRWQDEIEALKEIRSRANAAKIKKLHEEIRGLQWKRYAGQKWVATLVVLTLLLGVMVNEFCSGMEYVAHQLSPAEILSRQNPGACEHGPVEQLKIALSVLTIILLSFVVRHWMYHVKILSAERQLRNCYLASKDLVLAPKTSVWSYLKLLLEMSICAIHPLPFVHEVWEFDLAHDGWGMPVIFYRFESILVAFMFLRIYLLWRWFRHLCYHKFLHLDDSFAMGDDSVADMDLMKFSGNVSGFFHLKVMVSKYPVRVISSMVSVAFLSICYLVRITEGPAYQPHSADWWDQMW